MEEQCKYCTPKNPKTLVGGKADYISAWVKIYINETDVRLGLNARGESDISTSKSINYCPMCGRKFSLNRCLKLIGGETMDLELELRNLENTYYKMNKRSTRYCIYHDPIKNNLIMFSPYDDCDVNSVCNSIRDSMYLYLTQTLNTQRNVLVNWSQVSGTTSDYTIYYDMPINDLKNKSYKEIWEYIDSLGIKYVPGYKYTEVRNKIAYRLAEDSYNDFATVHIAYVH